MYKNALMLVMLSAALAGAQSPATPPFRAVDGAFFALSVQDLEASVRWYSEKFGLKVESRFSQDTVAGAVVSGNGLDVELIAFAESAPQVDPFDAKTLLHPRGIVKVGFGVADFDTAIAALKSRGVEIVLGPFPPRKGQRANAILRDNSGNLIQLFGAFAP